MEMKTLGAHQQWFAVCHFLHFDSRSSGTGDLSQNKGSSTSSCREFFPLFCSEAMSGKRAILSEEMSQLWQPFIILPLKSDIEKQSHDTAVVRQILSQVQSLLSLSPYTQLEFLK